MPVQRVDAPVAAAIAVAASTGFRSSFASKRTCSSRSVRPVAAASEGRPSFARSWRTSAGQLLEEADKVLGLATELGAQLGPLGGDAGGTGVEVTLARHVASESDEHRGAEGELVGAEKRRDDNVACRAQAAIGAQTHAAAQAVVDEHLLRFSEPSSQGLPAYLMLESGEAPVPPELPAMTM